MWRHRTAGIVFRFGGLGFLFIQIHFFFQSVVFLGNEDRGGKEEGGRARCRILRDDLSVQGGFRVWSPSVGKWKGGGLIRVFLQPKKRTEGGSMASYYLAFDPLYRFRKKNPQKSTENTSSMTHMS